MDYLLLLTGLAFVIGGVAVNGIFNHAPGDGSLWDTKLQGTLALCFVLVFVFGVIGGICLEREEWQLRMRHELGLPPQEQEPHWVPTTSGDGYWE